MIKRIKKLFCNISKLFDWKWTVGYCSEKESNGK